MKSVMKHQFSQVPKVAMPRSKFDRSNAIKTTFDSAYLVPIFLDEVLPGDTFNLRTAGFCRLATPLFPFMDNTFMETFYFFVPYRLVWDNFQKFMGEQDNPGDSIDYLVPILDTTVPPPPPPPVPPAPILTAYDPTVGFANSTLADYFGIPTQVPGLTVSALAFRAYNLIYNLWFRDQNMQDSLEVPRDDGPDDPDLYNVVRRGKRHDYFTSCLPWPQKGPAVDLPLGTSAPIVGTDFVQFAVDDPGASGGYEMVNRDPESYYRSAGTGAFPNDTMYWPSDPSMTHLYADLSSATAATINSFRQALQLQVLYERDARGGTRYTEILRAHFGVTSPDARLQRPEYLGGGSQRMNINPVASTADNSGLSATAMDTGGLRAFGTVGFTGHGFVKSFVEHGLVIGLVNVRADINYQQGLNKMWSRRSKLDFYWPALANIGEQAVLNKEIYAQGTSDDDDVFGYQERYAEYRYRPSQICGQFRSNFAQSLDSWHLALDFSSLPVLSDEFIQDNPPFERVVQVESPYPQFIGDFYHSLHCARPMPLYGIPGSLMRF